MGLFLVLFWCSTVAGDILRYNSRFDVFNSRLGSANSRLARLRELAGKGLIYFIVFADKTTVFEQNRRNSRFHGKNREFCPFTERAAKAGGTASSDEAGDKMRHAKRGPREAWSRGARLPPSPRTWPSKWRGGRPGCRARNRCPPAHSRGRPAGRSAPGARPRDRDAR